MRKIFYYCTLAAALAVLGWSAEASGQAAAKAKSAAKSRKAGAKKAPAKKTVARKSTKSGSKATTARRSGSSKGRKTGARAATTWRNRQLTPTPERYQEIQSALASKGFLDSQEVNGRWGPSSIDALKRFQTKQNLDATGKIDAMSLIGLGLGPRHDQAAAKPAEPPPAPGAGPSPEPGRP